MPIVKLSGRSLEERRSIFVPPVHAQSEICVDFDNITPYFSLKKVISMPTFEEFARIWPTTVMNLGATQLL